jgi:ubiquinone/menaquinone biosynthesis C-methylase UbiE
MANHFDQKAQEFDNNPIIQEMGKIFARTLRQRVELSSESRLLDFGCGTGQIGLQLSPLVGSLVMVDSSQGMLARVREKVDQTNQTNVVVMSVEQHTALQPSPLYDCIYTNMVLHHIADIPGFARQMHGQLRTGGTLCIGDLYKEEGTFHGENPDVRHFGFEPAELSHTLESCGFSIATCECYHSIKKPDAAGVMREYPLFFLAARREG